MLVFFVSLCLGGKKYLDWTKFEYCEIFNLSC